MSQPTPEESQAGADQKWPTYQSTDPVAVPAPRTSEPPAVPAAPRSTGPSGVVRPGFTPQDPLRISAGGGGVKKEGVWTVPPYLSIHGDIGSVRLDFRRAEVTSQVIWVEISAGAGSILIIVPQGWAAQLDRVTPGWGSRKSTVIEEPVGDSPVLVLSGSAGMGSIRVRYPTPRDERRLRRQLARERRGLR